MQALWRDDVASFDGEFVHLSPSWSWPKPVAAGRPSDPHRRRARTRSSSRTWPSTPTVGSRSAAPGVRAAIADLHRACEARGRDPEDDAHRPVRHRPRRGQARLLRVDRDRRGRAAAGGRYRATACCRASTSSRSWSNEPRRRSSGSTSPATPTRGARPDSRSTPTGSSASGTCACRPGVGEHGDRGLDARRRRTATRRACTRTARSLLDHLVVFTDDPDRTVADYADLGLEVRRVRELGNGRTQTFFRAGEVIIELVGPTEGDGDAVVGTVADGRRPRRVRGAARRPARRDQGRDAAGPADRDAAPRGRAGSPCRSRSCPASRRDAGAGSS